MPTHARKRAEQQLLNVVEIEQILQCCLLNHGEVFNANQIDQMFQIGNTLCDSNQLHRAYFPPILFSGYVHQMCGADHDTIPIDIIRLCMKFITVLGTQHLTFKPFSETRRNGTILYYQHICVDEDNEFQYISPEELRFEDIYGKPPTNIVISESLQFEDSTNHSGSNVCSALNNDTNVAHKECKTVPSLAGITHNLEWNGKRIRNLSEQKETECTHREKQCGDIGLDTITKIMHSHIAMEQKLMDCKADLYGHLFELQTKMMRLENENRELKKGNNDPWTSTQSNDSSEYSTIKAALQRHCGPGWKQYFENFKNEEVTDHDLTDISEHDIKATLIPKLGPRKRFLKWLGQKWC